VADLRTAAAGVNVRVTEVTNARGERVPISAEVDGRSTNLRARTAAAIRVQTVTNGVRFVVSGRRIDPKYGDQLARYLIAGKRRWRHQIFSSDWSRGVVMQQSQDVWFQTLRPHLRNTRKAIKAAMDDTIRKLS
jgi:hypothetical protein